MKLRYFLLGFIFTALLPTSTALAEVSRSAFRVSSSASVYNYYAEGSCQTAGEGGIKMDFVQSDVAVGMDTPKKYLGPFYFALSVNNVTLTQSDQMVCLTDVDGQSTGAESTAAVPEKAFLHTRELYGTMGTEFGFFFIDVSLGAINVKGNYYVNNVRYDADRYYNMISTRAILEFDLFSWGKYGFEVSTLSTPSKGDYTQGYIEYQKAGLFVKILL